ncbi:hypothetical protein JOQ06_015361 [Pogonophryne albipinna]|uniref:Endonuclease/exonuclease/phosphatase domain-containing protein n=1 Tax=Pogonophryne albipinna TaxID=1090488 RepID=A0AAD6AE19_9TELE|nr:hypothetical protein JOQ06_015361 [Pogonophryne albipinna]
MRLLCALGLFLALLHVTSCLLIGAFNIPNFGPKKSGIDDPKKEYEEARNIIKEIVQRYDIILIQGLQDKDLSVTKRLKALVNKGSDQFSYIVSEPLPLGSSIFQFVRNKERYLFLYKNKKVTVKDSFQYTASGFNRPPFVVQFSSTQTAVKEFVLIPIHTKPGSAVKEIDALVGVVKKAERKWTNNNIMVLGDFNADGKHVKAGDWKKIRLFDTNKNFHWLIANGVDTTLAAKSSNTYDRIVVTTEMEKGVVPGSAGVFDFREKYDLRDKVTISIPCFVFLCSAGKSSGPELRDEMEGRRQHEKEMLPGVARPQRHPTDEQETHQGEQQNGSMSPDEARVSLQQSSSCRHELPRARMAAPHSGTDLVWCAGASAGGMILHGSTAPTAVATPDSVTLDSLSSTATGLSVFASGTAPALVVDSHGSASAESEAAACDSREDGDRTTDACICEMCMDWAWAIDRKLSIIFPFSRASFSSL